jgi:YXWGXW repeat-containing protein
MKRSAFRWVLLSVIMMAFSAASFGQVAVGISVRIGPPALPVYAQPICPGPGYIWTPGYWAWNDDGGYYWVPGTWVVAPVGMLWTPGYWGWGGGVYLWHPGYWGPHVGFYGGINYGYGYGGVGFVGGEWRSGGFYYNRSVTNVSVTNVTNVYNKTVIVNNTTVNNVSYNGGNGGIQARPTAQEQTYASERHTAPLATQMQHQQAASSNRQNFASVNQGRPAIAATERPGDFNGRSVVAARAAGAAYHPPAMAPKEARVVSPAANRPANNVANRPANNNVNRGNNEGFRPFTPPNRGNSSSPNKGNTSPANQRSNNNVNRGNNDGFRSFNPPRNDANRGNENRPNPNQGRYNESRPQSQPREASPPPRQQNVPRSSPPPQQQHHQGPPPKEEHRSKGR